MGRTKPLVTNEPVEFEKHAVEVHQDFGEKYRSVLKESKQYASNYIKKPTKRCERNRLDLENTRISTGYTPNLHNPHTKTFIYWLCLVDRILKFMLNIAPLQLIVGGLSD